MANYYNSNVGAVVNVAGSVNVAGNLTMGTGAKLKLDTTVDLANCALQFNGEPDCGMSYTSANVWRNVAGGAYTIQHQAGLPGWNGTIAGAKVGLVETTDVTPSANITYIYSRDTAGKTQMVARAGLAGTEAILVTEV